MTGVQTCALPSPDPSAALTDQSSITALEGAQSTECGAAPGHLDTAVVVELDQCLSFEGNELVFRLGCRKQLGALDRIEQCQRLRALAVAGHSVAGELLIPGRRWVRGVAAGGGGRSGERRVG